MESFFHSFKGEGIDGQFFQTRAQARSVTFDYLETFYNRTRRHLSVGSFFCQNGLLCVISRNWRIYASATRLKEWPCFMALRPVYLASCLWAESRDLKKFVPARLGNASWQKGAFATIPSPLCLTPLPLLGDPPRFYEPHHPLS